jgi:hypothetical protein
LRTILACGVTVSSLYLAAGKDGRVVAINSVRGKAGRVKRVRGETQQTVR